VAVAVAGEAGKHMTNERPHKYLYTLLYLTLGFGAVVAGCFIAGEYASGWDGLSYVLYGMAAAALWALISVIYLIWIVIRGGWRNSKIPALFFIVVILGVWAFLIFAEY
jgi:hypothetical protein